jgi:hypothetical protein
MNPEEKKEYDEDPMFIPYTDRVVFEYGGGAAGPQSFGEDIKEEFMKKHQLLSDENNDNKSNSHVIRTFIRVLC